MKYQYRIFAPTTAYFSCMLGDLLELKNVSFKDYSFKNNIFSGLLRFLYHIHNSKINRYIELPGKCIWNRLIYRERVIDTKSLCFLFFMSDLRKNKECFFRYLRKKYPGCKMVMYFEDIVASRGPKDNSYLDFTLLEKYFDLAISYDEGDCEKYGFLYYPTPYSVQRIQDNPKIECSDVFFCGMAKNRYDEIKKSHNLFVSHSIKTEFIVVAEDSLHSNSDGIDYRTSYISYKEYLQYLAKTKCILELMQSGATGYTLRVWEALVYGKKLITNNKAIIHAPFYDPVQFRYTDQISEDDINFINESSDISPRYIREISPIGFLHFIENNI